MRLSEPDKQELFEQFKEEKERFKVLDKQKLEAWRENDLRRHEDITIQWQDSSDEVNFLHRKLYPYFPRSGTCVYCGCDMMPVGGTPQPSTACICCGKHHIEINI